MAPTHSCPLRAPPWESWLLAALLVLVRPVEDTSLHAPVNAEETSRRPHRPAAVSHRAAAYEQIVNQRLALPRQRSASIVLCS